MSSIEDFRGDYDQLAAAMELSWADSVATPFLYTADFLANSLNYPGSAPSLAPAIYHDSELVAFVAGIPRTLLIQGEVRCVLIVAFLTVASAYKASGYGILVWSDLVRRAAAAGLDGVVNYCVDGEAMNRMIEGSCHRLDLPLVRAFSVSYLSRVIWPKRPVPTVARSTVDAATLLKAAEPVADEATISRIWTSDEADWQLGRHGGISVAAGRNAETGMLSGYVMPIADRGRTRCLIIDDVLWGDLPTDGREGLACELVAAGSAAGARVVILPVSGYADTQPFLASGFRPSRRTIHAYLTLWNGSMPTDSVPSYYVDVF